MITLFSLFKQRQVIFQFLRLGKGHSIDTGKHLTLFIPSPISTSDVGQLDRFDKTRIWNMRPTAEVCKIALLVKSDGSIFQSFQKIELVLVSLLLEIAYCIFF